jgi:Zn finger protein HypA/HybF involved in hydrogenase expression
MELPDLLTDVLGEPFTISGHFQLRCRYVHLTYPLHPPATSPNSIDPSWVLSRLEENLATKGFNIGEYSACCERLNVCRFFTPPQVAPVTHVAIQITGKDEVRQFMIKARNIFRIGDWVPIIRIITEEEHWKGVFTYHRREEGPLVQSGEPRPWAVRGIGPLPNCQYGGGYRILCDGDAHYDCPGCFPRSFAASERADNLRADYTGSPVIARMVFLNSNKTYQFECTDCWHPFHKTPNSVTSNNRWCPYCAGSSLCGCSECNKRSLSAHPASRTLIDKTIDTDLIPISSELKLSFCCRLCAHHYEAQVRNVTATNENYCPYCARTKKLCKDPNCWMCYERSFATHPKAFCAVGWNPRNFPLFHNGKKPFRCDTCAHDFEAQLNDVSRGTWCPACKHKTQARVHELLERSPYRVDFDKDNTPRPNGRVFRLDWLVHTPRGPVCIELDGRHHFQQIAQWGGSEAFARTRARDAYKMLYWLSRRARFIRLHQVDVFAERFDWRGAIMHAIEVSTDPVVCLEAIARDSWADLRAEVLAWWGKPVEAWLEKNAARLDLADETEPTEDAGEE